MHIDARLPDEIELGAERRERFNVEVATSDSGYEDRNSLWEQPLVEYEISFPPSTRDATPYTQVIAAFRATGGGRDSFDLEDWSDHEATNEPFGTGDGLEDTFSLIKTYTFGSASLERRVYRPGDDLVIKANGVTVSSSDYTVSDIGVVEFDTPPANEAALTWSGTFYIPVRFDMELSLTGLASHLDHIDTFSLVEVRLRSEDFA
jgi:uncharacterized protein (TIGR02217 family)